MAKMIFQILIQLRECEFNRNINLESYHMHLDILNVAHWTAVPEGPRYIIYQCFNQLIK